MHRVLYLTVGFTTHQGGTYVMKKKVLITTTLGLLLLTSSVGASSQIVDVAKSAHKDAIYNVVDKGYMGYTSPKGTFSPKNQVNREQLAQILTNFETKLQEQEVEAQQVESTELTTVGNTMKSVVKITTGNVKGSGVFIDENTILTAYHVVDKANGTVDIQLSDYSNVIKGTVHQINDWQDIAIIKIDNTLKDNNYKVKPINLASVEPKLGETVYAFGNPRSVDFSVSKGIISHTSQSIAFKGMYQFDASVHPGNSGGPLVNENGQLVGIVNSVLTDGGTNQYDGISFATKLDAIKTFVKTK